METKEVKASLADAFSKIEDVKKSLVDSEVVKNEAANEDTKDEAKKSVEADKAEKSDEVVDEEEKSAKEVKISDDNEKATKKADEAKKSDDDEVEESVHHSKKENEAQDEATKSADEAEKSENTDEAEKSAKAPKEVAKPKEIDKIEDKEGHEQASKSADVDLMAKSLDAMVEMHKAYQAMAELTIKSLQAENATLRKSIADADVKKSVKKDVDDPDAGDVDGKSAKAERCNKENIDKEDQQASKSVDKDDNEECDDEAKKRDKGEAKKSVEESDDEVAKSMPEGKAVSAEAPEADDEAEKSLKMGDFKSVLVKSISVFANTQDSENLHRSNLLKSLYADVRDVADDEAVSDNLINRYNNI